MGRIQRAIMQTLVNRVAEKSQYDTNNISELHKGSVVFRDELEGIVNESASHFDNARRQTINLGRSPLDQKSQQVNTSGLLDIETEKWANQEHDELPNSDKYNSDKDDGSDLSEDGYVDRKCVILSKSEMEDDGSPTLKFPSNNDDSDRKKKQYKLAAKNKNQE